MGLDKPALDPSAANVTLLVSEASLRIDGATARCSSSRR
jgi:hypothetical protein